jgi:hypothetical protein
MRPRQPRYPDAVRLPPVASAGSIWWSALANVIIVAKIAVVTGAVVWW